MKSPRYEEFPTIGMTAIIIALVSLVFLVIHDMQENRKLRDACNGVGGYWYSGGDGGEPVCLRAGTVIPIINK